jgi:cytochrome b561/polyisoprenoid-binding protein YceI
MKPTLQAFSPVSKIFHWGMAVCIFGLLAMGFLMADMEPSPLKFKIYWWHKSFGILILFLAGARIAWRILMPRPAPTPTLKPWEEKLAKIVHFALYALFIAIPVSGLVMSAAGDFPAEFFGLFAMPKIAPKDSGIFDSAREMHETFAWAIIGLICLHLAGALKHHFIDRDETLRRMTTPRLGFTGGIILAALAGAAIAAPVAINLFSGEEEETPAAITAAKTQDIQAAMPSIDNQATAGKSSAMPWAIDTEASFIKFTATQYGQPFEGQFKRFGAQINFDPDNHENSSVNVNIGLGTEGDIATGSTDRDAQITGAEWFNTAQYPAASFVAESFKKNENGQYVAQGILTIRGVSKNIDLPFTLDIHEKDGKKTADMRGTLTLNRLDFGLGQGQWAKTDVIGDDVSIEIYVKASAAP